MINERKVLAVVTARANSIGLPHKNYRSLLGVPLVIWSVKAAFHCKYIDTIYVSTNCQHVKKIVHDWVSSKHDDEMMYGVHGPRVHVVNRPEELATPTSKNEEALMHAVQHYEEWHNETPYYVVNLQPTSPVRHKNLLNQAIEIIYDSDKKSLMTVSQHTPFFIQSDPNKGLVWHFDRLNRKMRQNLSEGEMYLHDDGCLYIMETTHLFEEICRLDNNPCLLVNDKYSSFQIDDEIDFSIVEKIKEKLDKTGDYI